MTEVPPSTEKLRILRELDVHAALNFIPKSRDIVLGGYKDTGEWADVHETALASLHKARLAQPMHFNEHELELSRKWLFNNGWRITL